MQPRRLATVWLALAGLSWSCALPKAGAGSPAVGGSTETALPAGSLRLAAPGYLPAEARQLLQSRMRRHQQDVESLLNNALLLDFEGAQRAAANVIDEPRLARPGPNDQDALNTRLPEHFFVLQDELVERAREVQVAGQAHDSQRLARASGDLTRTCIACHAAYLQGPNP